MSTPGGALSMLRAQWATRMTDTCVIKGLSSSTFSTTTGQTTPTYTTYYTGDCLVRPGRAADTEQAGIQVDYRRYTVFIPYDEITITVGMLVDVTSTGDGLLDGKQLTVRNVSTDTYVTKRILECEDRQDG